jgi:predicted transcriptional regulator
MKTLAIRLDDELHAQLSVLAQLRNSTITNEIRLALETHLEASKNDTELTNRAQAVLDDIEREAEGRRAAIATLFGPTAEPAATGGKPGNKRSPAPKGNAPG